MIKFNIKNQIIEREDAFRVVADSREYLTARFEMTEEWQGRVFAVFGFGGAFFQVILDENGCCNVPFEVIKTPCFSVSAFCDGEKLVTANVVIVDVEASGFSEGGEPSEPTPTLWQQYINMMNESIEKGLPQIGENKNWFLFNPESGQYEDAEVAAEGKDGHSPVKGVDYFTEDDKSEIVEDVLAALPDGDEVSY